MFFKKLIMLGVCGATAACGLQQAADEYPVDARTAYKLLNDSSLPKTAFNNQKSFSLRKTNNQITWRNETGYDQIDCVIGIDPVEEQKTKIAINCGSGPAQDTAMVPMTANMARQEAIEMIDATLRGREFDRSKKGNTAYRWPDNQGDFSPQVATPAQRAALAGHPNRAEDVPDGWYD